MDSCGTFFRYYWYFFSLHQWTKEEKGTQRELQVLFNHGTFFCGWCFGLSPCVLRGSSHGVMSASLWIERRELRTFQFVNWCIISFMSDMQAVQNIFYFSEHMSWTHGFCKPLLCGCTYSYFVYWNKERHIYKIIKWSSPSSLHGQCMFISFSFKWVFNDLPCSSFCRNLEKTNPSPLHLIIYKLSNTASPSVIK